MRFWHKKETIPVRRSEPDLFLSRTYDGMQELFLNYNNTDCTPLPFLIYEVLYELLRGMSVLNWVDDVFLTETVGKASIPRVTFPERYYTDAVAAWPEHTLYTNGCGQLIAMTEGLCGTLLGALADSKEIFRCDISFYSTDLPLASCDSFAAADLLRNEHTWALKIDYDTAEHSLRIGADTDEREAKAVKVIQTVCARMGKTVDVDI